MITSAVAVKAALQQNVTLMYLLNDVATQL
jgi:hypothetical protein